MGESRSDSISQQIFALLSIGDTGPTEAERRQLGIL